MFTNVEILFASNNEHKVDEVRAALPRQFTIRSLREVMGDVDIPETGVTLQENAAIKARFLFAETGMNCFADDTGLEITALNGAPGVYSARYASEGCSFDDNMNKVLANLEGETNRSARFRTVICLILEGKEYFFEGEIKGEILTSRVGEQGFGYDPIFKPEGYQLTFAQMTVEQKNTISHRGLAIQQVVEFLTGNIQN
jgi:XTP/dITP diphosphohydrolase